MCSCSPCQTRESWTCARLPTPHGVEGTARALAYNEKLKPEEEQSDSEFDLEREADRYAESEMFANFYGAGARSLYD